MRELSGTRRYSSELRKPVLRDVRHALDASRIVILSIAGGRKTTAHDILVYEREGDGMKVYYPFDGHTIAMYGEMQVSRWWLRSEGMTVIWQP